jgi:hypothetical protein
MATTSSAVAVTSAAASSSSSDERAYYAEPRHAGGALPTPQRPAKVGQWRMKERVRAFGVVVVSLLFVFI